MINLVQHATDYDSWVGRKKITFVNKNAMHLTQADIGVEPIDFLYIDIWPELGMAEAVPQTQAIQSVVRARTVGWWGQEIDFIDWLSANRPAEHIPTTFDLVDFMQAVNLPIEEQSADYVLGCRQAAQMFATYRELLRAEPAPTHGEATSLITSAPSTIVAFRNWLFRTRCVATMPHTDACLAAVPTPGYYPPVAAIVVVEHVNALHAIQRIPGHRVLDLSGKIRLRGGRLFQYGRLAKCFGHEVLSNRDSQVPAPSRIKCTPFKGKKCFSG